MARVLLVGTVKDEGANIFEWIAHHRAIGFTDFAIYENGSSDKTRQSLRLMDQLGYIHYFRNEIATRGGRRPGYQNRAYQRSSKLDVMQECEWCMALDADEITSRPQIDTQKHYADLLDNQYIKAM